MNPRATGSDLTWLFTAVLLGASGCDAREALTEDPPEQARFEVWDSAGVRMAESRNSSWGPGMAWSVDPEPRLQLGSRTGEGGARVFGAVGPVAEMSDGRLIVGDRQALEILVFSGDGEFLEVRSGPGDGPGEIRRLDELAVIDGDRLIARNDGVFRHEIFDATGAHLGTVRAPAAEFFETRRADVGAVGWMADGRFVVGPARPASAPLPAGRSVVDAEWHLFDPDGTHRGLLARRPDRVVVEDDGWPGVVVYGARGRVATDDHGLWHGFSDRWELRHITPDGVDRIVRLSRPVEPVSGQLTEDYHAWYRIEPRRREGRREVNEDLVVLSRQGYERDRAGVGAPSISFADSLPAFVRVVISLDGHLWLREHATAGELTAGEPGDVGTTRWTVLDPEGRWLGTVHTPDGLRIEVIGRDHVVGVWHDEDDVSYVRVHGISKPAG